MTRDKGQMQTRLIRSFGGGRKLDFACLNGRMEAWDAESAIALLGFNYFNFFLNRFINAYEVAHCTSLSLSK